MSDSQESQPRRGLAGEIHRARTGAKATAAELREFVQEFRGRTPQEMFGYVAGNSLFQATMLATAVTAVLMLAFTIGPYIWYPPVAVAAKPAPAAAPKAAPSATAAAPVASGTAAVAPPPAAVATGTAPNVLGTLGIGETKIVDPKKNPLEAGGDDLLKDLK